MPGRIYSASASNALRLVQALVLLVGAAVMPVFAADRDTADTPHAWLERMDRAFRELSYDGTFSYFNGSDLASLRVVHKEVDGVQRERLVHLNGKRREIVRKGDEVACIVMPGDELLELESSIPSGPFARAFVRGYQNVQDHYRLTLAGSERIADRLAVRIDVQSRDADRYGYRLWLDEANAMLLRSELVSAGGQRLEIFQFSRIAFGNEVDDAALRGHEGDGAMISHLRLSKPPASGGTHADVPWTAAWLPGGFRMTASDIRRKPSDLSSVHTLMYSDGLAAFSVFIESMPQQGAGSMRSRMGATVTLNRRMQDGEGAEYLFTLVGELPDDTAERILSGFESSR